MLRAETYRAEDDSAGQRIRLRNTMTSILTLVHENSRAKISYTATKAIDVEYRTWYCYRVWAQALPADPNKWKNRSQTASKACVASSTASGNGLLASASDKRLAYTSRPQLLILIYQCARLSVTERPRVVKVLAFEMPFFMHSWNSSSGSSSVPWRHSGIVPLNVCCRLCKLRNAFQQTTHLGRIGTAPTCPV